MKQKTTNNNPVTEEQLIEVLKDYPTKADLKRELNDRLTKSQNAFRQEMRHEFSMMNEQWERRFTTLLNQMHSLIDPLLQETKTRQQEREITSAQKSAVRATVDDIEKRIVKLEYS